MKVAILKERRADETRVAAVPETVKKLVALGLDVVVEKAAGKTASVPDAAYRDAGATIANDPKSTLKGADIVLKIRSPMIAGDAVDELVNFSAGQILICQMYALRDPARAAVLAATGVTGFALEMAPRITRAQSMDILSSQSNLAGYKSVLDAAAEFGRAFPMMMTAAGTIAPARVLVMGVG
ncbi:MAG: NAD(P) transhydrogenase subunit alpha part 1, partial [Alphaproteobacteria bacterium MarineAlpha10_Bin3]